jgi:hypothetical protein
MLQGVFLARNTPVPQAIGDELEYLERQHSEHKTMLLGPEDILAATRARFHSLPLFPSTDSLSSLETLTVTLL